MLDCTVTSTAGTSDLTVVVIGHGAVKVPRLIETQAAGIAKGTIGAPLHIVTPEGRFLLLKLEAKAWLVGGENWRLLGKDIVDAVRQSKTTSAAVLVGGKAANVSALVEGVLLADYRYNLQRSGKEAKRTAITVRFPGHAAEVITGQRAAAAQNLARELADMPPNLCNPVTFAARAMKASRQGRFSGAATGRDPLCPLKVGAGQRRGQGREEADQARPGRQGHHLRHRRHQPEARRQDVGDEGRLRWRCCRARSHGAHCSDQAEHRRHRLPRAG